MTHMAEHGFSLHTISMSPTSTPTLLPFFTVPNLEIVLAIIVTIIFIWWAIFTIVAAYHLLRYARDSWMTIPAIAIHLFVSGWIFVFATGGLH